MPRNFKIIDLFAGPGGLGEGFSAFRTNSGDSPFKIALSVEKDPSAHKTLALRSFYRQFPDGEVAPQYYDYIAGRLGKDPDDSLFMIPGLRKRVAAARTESQQLTLGKDNRAANKAIADALGKKTGPWVLIGGPPCQAYSLVGRSRNRGVAGYEPEKDHRNFLYREYLKVLARFTPDVFVMENVKGLLSARVGGENVFSRIREDLLCPARALRTRDRRVSYEIFPFVQNTGSTDLFGSNISPSDFVIRAEKYGIPQNRHRVIILGIRSDRLRRAGLHPLNESRAPRVKDAIGDLPRLRSGLSRSKDGLDEWKAAIAADANKIAAAVARKDQKDVADLMLKSVDQILASNLDRGSNWAIKPSSSPSNRLSDELRDWYAGQNGAVPVTNHDTRAHITKDLVRYLYCSCFGVARSDNGRATPNSGDFPEVLAPHHASWSSGSFADRFRVQTANLAATTITSHISKDGHYFIHYDPTQCRSLTVREAARIQTFPDDYFFVGNRTQQYVQVGNAVPPFLARQLAEAVFDILK